MNERTKGFLLVILSAAVFGVLPFIVRSINACGSNSVMTSFLRFLLSLIPLYLAVRGSKAGLRITKTEALKILLIAVCGLGGTSVLLSCNRICTVNATDKVHCSLCYRLIISNN